MKKKKRKEKKGKKEKKYTVEIINYNDEKHCHN